MAGRRASTARGRGGNSIPTQDANIEARLASLEESSAEHQQLWAQLQKMQVNLAKAQRDLARSNAEVGALNKNYEALSQKYDDLRAIMERTTSGGHEANSDRRRSDLLSFLPGEQLVNDYEVDNGQQQSAGPPPSALSDLMDALVPAWPKDGRMSPQREQQQQDHQPLRHSLLIAPELPITARISAPIEESSVQQEQMQQQMQQHQPCVESAPKNRRKSVRFKSPDETFHDQVQGASISLAAHLSSPDPLSSALPLRSSATISTPKAAASIAATTTKPSNRLQRARRASRGGRRLTVALGLVEKGELNDDDGNNNNNYNKISYPDLTTKAPRDSPYVSVSQQESSTTIAVLQASEDSDTIAVAPRKSTRKRALKDFGDVEVGYPKKKSAK